MGPTLWARQDGERFRVYRFVDKPKLSCFAFTWFWSVYFQAVKFRWILNYMKQGTRQDAPPGMPGLKKPDTFNDDEIRATEIPSANGHASARGID